MLILKKMFKWYHSTFVAEINEYVLYVPSSFQLICVGVCMMFCWYHRFLLYKLLSGKFMHVLCFIL